jgi:hypothetical protein
MSPSNRIGPSMVYMLESQFRYVLAALRAARERSLQRLESATTSESPTTRISRGP